MFVTAHNIIILSTTALLFHLKKTLDTSKHIDSFNATFGFNKKKISRTLRTVYIKINLRNCKNFNRKIYSAIHIIQIYSEHNRKFNLEADFLIVINVKPFLEKKTSIVSK